MRRLSALLVLCLALAAPAGAQESGRIQIKPPADGAGLRGAVGGLPAARASGASALADLIPAPLPVTPTALRANDGARQCRRACSREYYFCLSGEDDRCPQIWTRCVSGCGT